MAMEQNNQWWRQRSKHGRGLLFSSPELMWEAACEYFDYTDNRTDLTKNEIGWFQGQATVEQVVCRVPYTWQGIGIYFGCSTSHFKNKRLTLTKRVKEGTNDESDDDFLAVIKLIEDTIFSQQFNNAQAGVFKEGLTARYLKMQDSTELSTPNNPNGSDQTENEFKITLKLE